MSELELVARVFRCGRGHKNTIGIDYLEQVGPWPEACTMPLDGGGECGDPWTTIEDIRRVVPRDDG